MREQDWKDYVRERLRLDALRPEREAEIVIELAQQLAEACAEARARGLSPAEARAAAEAHVSDWRRLADEIGRTEARRAGGPAPDRIEGARGPQAPLAGLWHDIRYSLRTLAKSPTFTFVVLSTLALAIGANTAIFTVFHAALLRPLPYERPDELVTIPETVPRQQFSERETSWPNFADWKERQRTFRGLAGYTGAGFTVLFPEGAERISATRITWNFLRVLGVKPLLGRDFEPGDEPAESPGVVLLTHRYWTRRFASDPGVLGRTLVLDGVPFIIVGVLPADFHFALRGSTEAWAPLRMDERRLTSRTFHWLNAIGRLNPGVSLETAQSELATIAESLAAQFTKDGASVLLHPLRQELLIQVRPVMTVLMSAVGFVLLLACVNVANLMLARAAARQRQTAIRVALGASRGSLLRQVLVESLLLAFAGGALGVLWAILGVKALAASLPPMVLNVAPYLQAVGVSWPALLFTMGATLLAALASGLAPAWHASRALPQDALRDGVHGSTTNRLRLRRGLVVSQLALALVLLVGAGLMLRSLERLLGQHPGFRSENLQTFHLLLPQVKYPKPEQVIRFYDELRARLAALPGIVGVATTNNLPLTNDLNTVAFSVEGRTFASGEEPEAAFRTASPEYFEVMGIPLLAGRSFRKQDSPKAPPVVVINEGFARGFLAGQDPLGRRVTLRATKTVAEIVGVVGDVKLGALDVEVRPTVYRCDLQVPVNFSKVALRVQGDRGAALAAAAREVRAMDPELPLFLVRTMEEIVAESPSVFSRRALGVLLLAMATPAVLLAAMGLYGVMSFGAVRRTPEMGLRMALGARPTDVFRLVVGEGLLVAALGIAIGSMAALLLARLLGSLLFAVRPADPLTFTVVGVLLAAVALAASAVPALRAARVDPLVALRSE